MRVILFLFLITMCMCTSKKNTTKDSLVSDTFDIEGHRGCRGLMPENTLPAFQKALELGVNTLELDLVISKDKQVVVSHEPYFRSGLSIKPDGEQVSEEEEKEHNLYLLEYEEIKKYDVGSLSDEKYPEKENIKTYKPLLSEVIQKARHYSFATKSPLPDFNIEIKRVAEEDNLFHPEAEEFVDLVLREVRDGDIMNNTIIQSFDPESLRIVKQKEGRLRTALLIANERSIKENIEDLGFQPDIYSCYFKLLDEASINYCKERSIKVIPWTVNEVSDMQTLIDLGVDGIITDYPDRLINLVGR